MSIDQSLHEVLLRRVRSEFLEMPGLRLTERQARRLWGLDEASCAMLLGDLTAARFLSRTRDGAFVRADAVETLSAYDSARPRGALPKV